MGNRQSVVESWGRRAAASRNERSDKWDEQSAGRAVAAANMSEDSTRVTVIKCLLLLRLFERAGIYTSFERTRIVRMEVRLG